MTRTVQGLPEPSSHGMEPTKAWAPRGGITAEVVQVLDAVTVGAEETDVDVEGGRVARIEADRVDADPHRIASPSQPVGGLDAEPGKVVLGESRTTRNWATSSALAAHPRVHAHQGPVGDAPVAAARTGRGRLGSTVAFGVVPGLAGDVDHDHRHDQVSGVQLIDQPLALGEMTGRVDVGPGVLIDRPALGVEAAVAE